METQKTTAKDFFIHLGAIVALYTVVVSLLNLLFTVIDKAYPPINIYNYYSSTYSISFPVATLIIFFPLYILLMWLMEKGVSKEPAKKNLGVRRWLTYITLFIAGITLAVDLVWVLYRFIDGQELTGGFLLKALMVLIVAGLTFFYYITDVRRNLSSKEKKTWTIVSALIVIVSIIIGFLIIGSPRTQQLYKYDEQKVSDLQNINNMVVNFYQDKGYIPGSLAEVTAVEPYQMIPKDEQTGADYEYALVGQSAKAYQLCATFNAASPEIQSYVSVYGTSWNHPAGHYCFDESIPVSMYKPVPVSH